MFQSAPTSKFIVNLKLSRQLFEIRTNPVTSDPSVTPVTPVRLGEQGLVEHGTAAAPLSGDVLQEVRIAMVGVDGTAHTPGAMVGIDRLVVHIFLFKVVRSKYIPII